MRPLRIAWKHRVRSDESRDRNVAGNRQLVMPWRGHAVMPQVAYFGTKDIAIVVDRDGQLVRSIDTPRPHDRPWYPFAIATTWPDEGIVVGLQWAWNEGDEIDLLWVDQGEASRLDSHLVDKPRTRNRKTITATADGGMLFSTAAGNVDLRDVGWPAEVALDTLYKLYRQAPFDDHVYVTDCVDAAKTRWHAPGRAACVADDVVVLEEGAALSKEIVARRASDGSELWRWPAPDRFVLGTIPMPAWSDDRLYIYDRAARRRAAWEREAMLVRTYPIPQNAALAFAQVVTRARERRAHAVVGPSRIICQSARTGDPHWSIDLDGDVVSMFAHPAWIACIVANEATGTVHVWRHDGIPIAVCPTAPPHEVYDDVAWPPDPTKWPCIVGGDEDHVVFAQNRDRRSGGPRIYEVRLDAPDRMAWEVRLRSPVVLAPHEQTLRLLNRAPVVLGPDAAYVRLPKQLLGLRG